MGFLKEATDLFLQGHFKECLNQCDEYISSMIDPIGYFKSYEVDEYPTTDFKTVSLAKSDKRVNQNEKEILSL